MADVVTLTMNPAIDLSVLNPAIDLSVSVERVTRFTSCVRPKAGAIRAVAASMWRA